ncbi:magnesium-transporting ATPase (P-type) [Clostridium acetobutylicum]|uniref:Predicted membrane protein n=1 Tax=Clostridium acetobutylicum (strain ATCC 824 / DSM 792 / JCM 1419 / IAM 19013 / LMG 5710 / NBRC 13948 / NRRL B-527 / VKM B-1787 / 2291 / W) TaxID=272562 RepID=Q97E88_CLOAB|nr:MULTISPECIES: hypothetical protein [Clostridium]AAK81162.1 Predicted membrane protein [Clostridium acetobutylicum ATCC 824]ADZ22267.1 membrane protein [Clostridium acetobutylicum EA 2018]AEI32718.1 hypothetical protein SMB_G3263 [Clostridium acetobutylicum DSM 1731]AWV81170.1 hypothetical protein DK921_13895 [Clostridium acetobutylicum]KHD35244.1 membrane protein [Clostridium acetobutylicum]
MSNFLISSALDIVLIFAAYFIFRSIISGPTRHKIYEKFISSFGKFVIYIFIVSAAITGIAAYIMYRTRFVSYLNIVAPALVSVFVGFVISTVPTRGVEDENNQMNKI